MQYAIENMKVRIESGKVPRGTFFLFRRTRQGMYANIAIKDIAFHRYEISERGKKCRFNHQLFNFARRFLGL